MKNELHSKVACVDLFCGAGGLTHGFTLEGLPVVAGIDLDPACHYPYTANNGSARFLERDVSTVTTGELNELFGTAEVKILAGCAPCQPFSTYAQRYELDGKDGVKLYRTDTEAVNALRALQALPDDISGMAI